MTLKKLTFKPGVNRENTRYTNENGWYESDKVRFRQGTPEKIGGWQRISSATYNGVCRSLWGWTTLGGLKLIGVGTNTKFYISIGGSYYDITPIRSQVSLTDPFTTVSGSSIITVSDAAGGYGIGDYVSFYGGSSVGGILLYGQYQIVTSGSGVYTIDAGVTAASSVTGGGSVSAVYQIRIGYEAATPLAGWGSGAWGSGAWGFGALAAVTIRLWSQNNFGEDLVFAPRGGGIYYWDASVGYTPVAFSATVASPTVITTSISLPNGYPIRFIPDSGSTMPVGIIAGAKYYVRNTTGTSFNISSTPSGALTAVSSVAVGTCRIMCNAVLLSDNSLSTDVPTLTNYVSVSGINRFIFSFGANEYGGSAFDAMLIRWCDQEDPYNWTPSATNQAGFLQLSRGSKIITAQQSRQELLVWTDSTLYSLQYVGAPIVWGSQLVGDNISIVGQNAVAYANGVAFWMGRDKFYKYDGTTTQLRCDLRKFIFENINTAQYDQVFAGTNEGFNEIWWFYCTGNSVTTNTYVVYNYVEDVWYYGTLARTAWFDSGMFNYPLAATYSYNIVEHEKGQDNNESAVTQPVTAYITSAEFDLDDGHNFMFIWRVLPDISFANSTIASPQATMYLLPMQNSGSGYNVNKPTNENHSVADSSSSAVIGGALLPIEEFTGQVYTRVRGRQMAIKVESSAVGVQWQLGSPRIDARPDGRR